MWALVAISSYFIFAAASFVDKYLLAGPMPHHRVYAFYIGILGGLALALIPFTDFYILEIKYILFSFIAGASFILGILWFFKGLKLYEPSRILPAVGGISPVFTILLIYIFSGGKEALKFSEIISFALIVFGSILITYEGTKKISGRSLAISAISAFFFAVFFIFSKYVYAAYPFLLGLIWVKISGAAAALIFLASSSFRNELFKQKVGLQKKTAVIFFSSQAAGAFAGIMQNFAIALAPLIYVAFINALQGVQYVFLLIAAIFLSLKFPHILKEEISGRILFQKIAAILIISLGLAILAIK